MSSCEAVSPSMLKSARLKKVGEHEAIVTWKLGLRDTPQTKNLQNPDNELAFVLAYCCVDDSLCQIFF
jgi:hypothetical protein